MRIGVDLDGVLYNFTASLSDYIGQAAGQWYSYRPSCWEFYETDWGMSPAEYLAWFEEGVDAGWIFAVGVPAKGSIEALYALKAKGHTIHLITDRNVGEKAKVNTTLWLSTHGVPYDTLTFCNGNKASLVNVDLAIDDQPKMVDEYRAAGVEAYCMGFDERTDMKANEWYIPYDWDNFQLIVEGSVRPIGLGAAYARVCEHYPSTPSRMHTCQHVAALPSIIGQCPYVSLARILLLSRQCAPLIQVLLVTLMIPRTTPRVSIRLVSSTASINT